MAQIDPEQRYHDWLMDRVVRFLQTRDRRIFPFTANFDEHQLAAFVRDLREGLSEVTHGGSARKTSATGFITSDQVLRRIIDEWSGANGDWPEGRFPRTLSRRWDRRRLSTRRHPGSTSSASYANRAAR